MALAYGNWSGGRPYSSGKAPPARAADLDSPATEYREDRPIVERLEARIAKLNAAAGAALDKALLGDAKDSLESLLAACRLVLESIERNLAADYLPETKQALRDAIAKAEGTA